MLAAHAVAAAAAADDDESHNGDDAMMVIYSDDDDDDADVVSLSGPCVSWPTLGIAAGCDDCCACSPCG